MEQIELLTKAEAAKLLAISEDTLESLIRGGQISAYRIAKTCTRLDRRDVMEYLESRKIRAAALRRSQVKARDIKARQRVNAMPSGYVPGMKVVEP